MKFKHRATGVILEPKTDMVIDQMKKNHEYEAVDDAPVQTATKPLSKMTKDELIATAQNAGIQVPSDANKAEIISLIEAAAD